MLENTLEISIGLLLSIWKTYSDHMMTIILALMWIFFQITQCGHAWEPDFKDLPHIMPLLSVKPSHHCTQRRGPRPIPGPHREKLRWLHGCVAWDPEFRVPSSHLQPQLSLMLCCRRLDNF